MSGLKSNVGQWTFRWKSIPRGHEGTAEIEVKSKTPDSKSESVQTLSVRWRRDADGLWISLPYGTFGYDLQGELDETGTKVFRVNQRCASGEWNGVSVSYGDQPAGGAAQGARPKAARVRAQMPGKIIRIMVKPGQEVQKDQPILVMEAMKMENEIRSPQAAKVAQIKVSEGQAVETGADLVSLVSGEALSHG